jgi:hypothetical protein
MKEIDKMSLKELRAMLKEKRKTTQAPVSKMKKGQLMKELITNSNLLTIDAKHEDAPDVYSKKTANQILEKSQVYKQYVPLEGYKYGAEEITRPGAKQFARMTGKTREAKGGKADKEYIGNETIQMPVGRELGKQSMKQTDQPVSASQKVAPATKRQTAKKTALAEVNEPVGASARAISEAMTVKSVRGRPPKNMGMGVGSDKEVPSSLAPPHLVISRSQSYEQQQMKPNLTRLEKPMKYGGGFVEIVEPKGQVAKQVVKIEEKVKSKRGGWDSMTAEQKAERIAKMKAGREKKKE